MNQRGSVSPLLLFVNPRSGGGLGQSVIDQVEGEENLHVVKLPDQLDTWEETERNFLTQEGLKVVVSGGDGSVNWVISLLMKHFENDMQNAPPIAVIPLGTGNDMARMLGWGSSFNSFDLDKIKSTLHLVRRSTRTSDLDIWKVSYIRTDIENQEESSKIMINYFSLGVDANIAHDFENCRQKYPDLFCCHCMSKSMYGPIAFKSTFGQAQLKEYVQGNYNGTNEEKELHFGRLAKTLILQNITSMYSGHDMWNRPGSRSINDGKIEIVELGGILGLLGVQLGLHAGNEIDQATAVSFNTSEVSAFEIDGEATIVNGPARFHIEKAGNYPMLYSQNRTG